MAVSFPHLVINSGLITSDHIFDWNEKIIYNPTEDFTVGNIADIELTFTSDLNLQLNQWIGDGSADADWHIIDKEKVNNSSNLWKYTIQPGYQQNPNETGLENLYDQIISDGTPWREGITLGELYHSIQARLGMADPQYPTYYGVNKDYVINNQAPYSGLTAREALRWCGQLGAFNIYGRQVSEHNVGGSIFRWNISKPYRRIRFTQNNIKEVVLKDYTVPAIDKIWFGNDSSDLGLSYGSGNQQLSVPINPLINYDDTSFLQPIYDAVSSPSFGGNTYYTPMKITTFVTEPFPIQSVDRSEPDVFYDYGGLLFDFHIRQVAEDFSTCYLEYTDENNTTYYSPIFSMEISPKGVIFEGTGTPDRSISNAYLTNELAQAGKWNKFQRTIDATISEIGNVDGRVSNLTQTVDGITVTVAGKVDKDDAISTDTLYYLATSASSGVTTSTSGWTTTIQTMTATNQYLWTYHKYTYADGHTTDSTPVITGRYGQNGQNGTNGTNGADGKGIISITPLYYAKANTTAPAAPTSHVTSTSTAGGAWRVAVPTLTSSYPYMFTCDEILYTDNTYGWSTVVQNSALTTFNSTLSQQADKIALVVEESQGTNVIKAASIVTAINGATSTVAISADHINLNGAVTANNNVTIGQDGVISAVGATLTNASIVGGSVQIRTAQDSNSVIRLTGPTGTYGNTSANMSPNGLDLWYFPSATKANLNAHDGQQSEWQQMDSSNSKKQYAIANHMGYTHKNYNGERFDLSASSLKFQNSAGTNTLQIYNSGAINVANKYRLGYYGSVGDNNGGFFELYKNNTETYPAISIDGHLQQFVIMDTSSGQIRALLDATGLYFYDANGNALNSYPAVNSGRWYWRVAAGGSWNVRNAPNMSGTVLTTVGNGDYPLVDESGDGWYKIIYDGTNQGWIGDSSAGTGGGKVYY